MGQCSAHISEATPPTPPGDCLRVSNDFGTLVLAPKERRDHPDWQSDDAHEREEWDSGEGRMGIRDYTLARSRERRRPGGPPSTVGQEFTPCPANR